jgi:P4 family phage/plasmid primase-like protien
MDEYRKFILQFRCKPGEVYSHTSIDEPKGSFKINSASDIDKFYEIYNSAMIQGVHLHMTEKPIEPSPLRVDLDFRFPIEHREDTNIFVRKYTKEDIDKIVNYYYKAILPFIDVKASREILKNNSIKEESLLFAYVMEKSKPVEYRGKLKDGIHIVFPYIVLSHTMQNLIRNKIIENGNDIFSGIPVINPHDDIIDKAIIDKNNWQMYGSRKPDCEPYRVTYKYDYNFEENKGVVVSSRASASEELTYPRLFSMRDKVNMGSVIYEEKQSELDEYVRLILPSIDERRKSKIHKQIFGKCDNKSRNLASDDDYNFARQIVVECLNNKRAENYEEWIKLGWTLRNIDYRLLDTWIEFSRLGSKYVEGECQNMWNKMKSDTLGIGTLRWWARNDNPKQYDTILRTNVEILIDKSISSDGAHYDVATVVHAIYKDKYRFTTRDTWYMYMDNRHKWVRTREGLKLRLLLSNDICARYLRRATYWTDKTRGVLDEKEREKYEGNCKKLMQISIRLKTAGYKDSVMKECKALFTDENFEETLDSHPHLIGFENGVYDLRMSEFREGLPDDYISFTTGRNYIDYDPESVDAKEIDAYLSQVFTNPSIKKYMKDLLTCIIDGGIRQEKFYIFTGQGCHAKDTEILMYDGTKKLVQDITESDILMGDDSKPRKVLKLFRGKSKMYRIIPKKGESFTVNEDHKLSLKVTLSSCPRITTTTKEYRVKWCEKIFYTIEDGSIVSPKEKCFKTKEEGNKYIEELNKRDNVLKMNDVIDVQVKNYINFNMKNLNLYLFRVPIEYPEQTIDIDPYILGCWLGDGHSRGTRITTMDPEIVDYFKNNMPENHDFHIVYSRDNGKAKTYNITYTGKKRRYISDNEVLNGLRKYKLIENKHIPIEYKVNSREVRLKLLAGIIDTDGTYQKHTKQYTVSQKNEKFTNDIVDLVRSLGFACYKKQFQGKCHNNGVIGTYYRVNIVGKGTDEIPCLLPRKQAEKRVKQKNVLLNNFKIENVPDDNYYGFEVSDNHRYIMGDYHVTANSNSKSAILNLIQKAIGDYYCILPMSLLTQKRAAANAAQSELERTKGRRLAVMQEPGNEEKINIGLMKELSGGDRIMARGLFKEPIEFRPQFKMVMTCNELPEVPSDDGGTWRRIRVVEYTSKFVDCPNPENPKEFPLDPELLDKFDKWADTVISMLIHNHRSLDLKNIPEPYEVRMATEDYKKNNDIIGQYVTDRLEKDPNAKKRMQLNAIFTNFKSWAVEVVPKGKKVPDRTQLKIYLEKIFGIYATSGWKGMKYKTAVEEVDSDVE